MQTSNNALRQQDVQLIKEPHVRTVQGFNPDKAEGIAKLFQLSLP